MPLVKLAQIHRTEPLRFVEGANLDVVVVDPDPPIRISGGDIQSQIVVEVIISSGEIELRKRGIDGMELEEIRTEDQPQEEHNNADEDDDGDDDLTDEIDDTTAAAVAEAAETTAAAASSVAAGGAVVGLGGGRNGRAVEGSVEMRLPIGHCRRERGELSVGFEGMRGKGEIWGFIKKLGFEE